VKKKEIRDCDSRRRIAKKLSSRIRMFVDDAVRVIRDGYTSPEWALKVDRTMAELSRVSAAVVSPTAFIE
jgi:hypothetical protein